MTDYQTRLRLDFDPFQPQAGARDFYRGAGRGELLTNLHESALSGGGLQLVTGELGSGKTSLAQEFCRRVRSEVECACVQASLFMDVVEFVRALAEEFAWPEIPPNPQEALAKISEYAAELDGQASTLQIVVDDAHELSREVITALVRLLEASGGGISILLLGEAGVQRLLEQALPEPYLARLRRFTLVPLSGEASFDYIRFKLATAGYTQPLPLPGGRLGALHNAAGGIPGQLNHLVAAALLEAPEPAESPAAVSLLQQTQAYWLAATGLVVLLIGAVVLLDGDRQPNISQPLPVPVARIERDQPESTETEPVTPSSLVAVPTSPAVESTRIEPQDSPANSSAERAAVVATIAAPAPEPQVAAEAETEDSFHARLRAAPAEALTIQVMGTRSLDAANEFLRTHPVDQPAGLVATQYQQQPWFIVLIGVFEDRANAERVLAALPASLRQSSPWIRPVAGLQTQLSATSSTASH